MYLYLYNSVIYNVTDVETIKELKQFITNNYKNINEENLKLSYTINKKTIVPSDDEPLIHYILYILTIKPIDCKTHKF
jgi:hypothetical protein